MTYRHTYPDHIEEAADLILSGEVIGAFFNGTYALLGDADRQDAADKIFVIKSRPRSKTLSLLTDPIYLSEFIDMTSEAIVRFPVPKIIQLVKRLHALGTVYPAHPTHTPSHLTQAGTVLNVWTDYPPDRPIRHLLEACRQRGGRGFLGASANLSGEPTYTHIDQMRQAFGSELPLIFEADPTVPTHRRKSTSLVDFTRLKPTLIREGNVPRSEIEAVLLALGLGRLEIDPQLKIL